MWMFSQVLPSLSQVLLLYKSVSKQRTSGEMPKVLGEFSPGSWCEGLLVSLTPNVIFACNEKLSSVLFSRKSRLLHLERLVSPCVVCHVSCVMCHVSSWASVCLGQNFVTFIFCHCQASCPSSLSVTLSKEIRKLRCYSFFLILVFVTSSGSLQSKVFL